jgi:hypothetical protein
MKNVIRTYGNWTIEDTRNRAGMYNYSLYFKGNWCGSAPKWYRFLKTIVFIDRLNEQQQFEYNRRFDKLFKKDQP